MKKILLILLVIASVSCVRQVVNQDVTFLDHHSFADVWEASILAIADIDFTIASMDRSAGFISAESGPRLFEDLPPRLSILIKEMDGKIRVDCRVLQKDQFIDLGGHGRKTVQDFMYSLNMNLNL